MVERSYPLVSCVIPLYRSKRFLGHILANLQALDYPNLEIIISDRHCLDDTLDQLIDLYSSDPRFRFCRSTDQIDWVSHMNFLLQQSTGEYFRLMPHDDSFPVCNLREMVSHLENNLDTVLVWGPTHLLDLEGNLKSMDTAPKPGINPDWTFDIPVLFNFDAYNNGAFKGLIRRDLVMDFDVQLRSTYALQNSERCWLFALSLLGKFHWMPSYQYHKRFYPESTSAQWRPDVRNIFSQLWLMVSSLWHLSTGWWRFSVGSLFMFLLTCRKAIMAILWTKTANVRFRNMHTLPPAWRTPLTRLIRWLVPGPANPNRQAKI